MISALKTIFDQAQRIALITHVAPDGDAYGSTLALYDVLKARGKDVCVYSNDPLASMYLFLPGMQDICPVPEVIPQFDLVVSLDAADEMRLGGCLEVLKHGKKTVCIDHHGTNPGYAQINLINAVACATSELLFDLLGQLGYSVSDQAKKCLFCGISTDTNHFNFNSVSAHTFEVAAKLRTEELDINEMTKILYRQRTVGKTRLIGHMLGNMRLLCSGKLAVLSCSHEECVSFGAGSDDYEGIINYGIETNGVQIAILTRTTAQQGDVKVSFRSVEPYDVAKLASAFGGGGHKLASGCTLHNITLEEACEELTRASAQLLGEML